MAIKASNVKLNEENAQEAVKGYIIPCFGAKRTYMCVYYVKYDITEQVALQYVCLPFDRLCFGAMVKKTLLDRCLNAPLRSEGY